LPAERRQQFAWGQRREEESEAFPSPAGCVYRTIACRDWQASACRKTVETVNFSTLEMDMSGCLSARGMVCMNQSEQFRINAQNCEFMSEQAISPPARKRFRRMAQAWDALAREQAWLDGEAASCPLEVRDRIDSEQRGLLEFPATRCGYLPWRLDEERFAKAELESRSGGPAFAKAPDGAKLQYEATSLVPPPAATRFQSPQISSRLIC
jgi:hypothetical protein